MKREEAIAIYEFACRGVSAYGIAYFEGEARKHGAPVGPFLEDADRARAASFLRKIADALDPQEQENPVLGDMTVSEVAEALGTDEVIECPNVFAGAQHFVQRHKRDKERTGKADK